METSNSGFVTNAVQHGVVYPESHRLHAADTYPAKRRGAVALYAGMLRQGST